MKSNFSKDRRDLLKSTCVLAGATAVATVGGSLEAFAAGGRGTQPEPPGSPQRFDLFAFTEGPKKGQEVMAEDIVLNAPPITVQAMDRSTGKIRESEHSTILLLRVDPNTIDDDIRGDTFEGIIGYSAVCTHQGCIVTGWDKDKKEFVCPCHQAMFDPLKGAVETSGPAHVRALPQIPVGMHDGKFCMDDAIVDWIGVSRGAR